MDERATALLEQATAAWDARQWESAAARYEELLALCPDAPKSYAWWYDAALAYKFLRNWPKALELGRHAAARAEPGTSDPAFWNLGIAATIQGDWAVARQAWTGYGINLPAGDGEIRGDFGTACVRLAGRPPEVVWVRRICPTRARVTSIPFGDRRFGEIVVHDGAPHGERMVKGKRYPVFDELLLCEDSATATYRATVSCLDAADLEALADLADDADLAMEPVSSLVVHPREESESRIEMSPDPARAGNHDVLLAAPDEAAARAVLERWTAAGTGRGWRGLREKQGSIVPAGSGSGHGHGHGHGSGDQDARPLEPRPDWPFEGGAFPGRLGVVAHRSLLDDAEPPMLVVHDRDGGWQALDAVSPAEPEYAVVVCMMCLVDLYPELTELADLPPGWAAERAEPGSPWLRREQAEPE